MVTIGTATCSKFKRVGQQSEEEKMSIKTKRKIAVVIASRANYGRIKAVLQRIKDHPDLEPIVIVSASALLWRYGQVVNIIRDDGFPVHATIYCVVEGENLVTMAKSTGLMICELSTIFENTKPDIVVTVADRYETIATAIAASYMNIPVAHVQGGEVTGSIDEIVRHSVTKLSHIHFPSTKLAAERILQMGEDPKSVIVTGCPSIDLFTELDLAVNDDLLARYKLTRKELDHTKPYVIVLQHPVTTEFGSGFAQVQETLSAVHALDMQALWLWPNVDAGSDDISKGLRLYREFNKETKIWFQLNFGPEDYARLLANAACIVGNSSSGIREGAFFGTPCVNIGTRQSDRERGQNVMDVGYDARAIETAIRKQIAHGRYEADYLYGDGNAAPRIVDALARVDLNVTKKFHGLKS